MSLDYLRVTPTETQMTAPAVSGGRVYMCSPFNAGDKPMFNALLANIVTAGAGTYTAAQILSGIITRDPTGASRTDTTDTAAAILAAAPWLQDGDVLKVYLINTADAAEVITLAGGVGVTISNVGQTLAQNEAATLLFRRTSSTTITLYIVGA